MNLSDTDKAYAAGVLDSDGTMGVYVARTGTAIGSGYVRISIGVQDDLLLIWLRNNWYGRIEHHGGTRVNKWTINRKADRIAFLEDVLPYLRTKRIVAKLILEFEQLTRGENKLQAEAYAAKIKEANHSLSNNWAPWVKELSTDKRGGE